MTRVQPSAVESLETHNLLTVSELVAREALGRRGVVGFATAATKGLYPTGISNPR